MEPVDVAARLVQVPGIVGVSLGGSRARGEHRPDSDTDLGLYYRPPLDTARLQALVDELSQVPAAVTEPGGWGPWVDGGGWLRVDGAAVDWIYRDVDRVRASCSGALAGTFDWHFQVGHPLGFPGTTYAGELFHGVLLADPSGELAASRLQGFSPALRTAVVGRLDEARFLLGGAAKAVPRGDRAYVAACAFRVVLLCVHALHADAGRFVLNEKGAVAATDSLPRSPRGFARRAQEVFALDPGPALDGAAGLLAETLAVVSEDGAQGPR
ncbi:nucleotidyltransferase domain-containing protein [Kineococcus rhizosphaerae]|uniref:Nucleotidyltransferase-like protein n=1 Tax=Kineococcus rhizosphaerae TaxID=559628 RepID=A0A2T0R2F5_9ACTN|nr:nucleotidyltransferase domain-containing protein [Kineococcus rhizosphaerae]PRY13976.1 nucleotidyltransferase-like protein [Kineococcus rhizosphaerae]